MTRIISWFGRGAASAVATKLVPEAIPVHCLTGSEHKDNIHFDAACAKWFGREIIELKSDQYTDTWDVWEKTRWLAGINGARCTTELKVIPRLSFQSPFDIHVFGYTADSSDVARATRLSENFSELTLKFPLIERGLTKASCLSIIKAAGIELPPMYAMGFPNNNCIPCVKATSPNYWALVRKEFPAQFERMVKLSRELDVRLCRIKGVRSFIDEIPLDWPVTEAIAPSCDFLCHMAENEF